MHFFADLKPYICTFADCDDELAQFPNRATWAEHEFSQHQITRSWSCPECPQAFNIFPQWQSHIQETHFLQTCGATHMEAIALMALPRNVEEDSEEGSVSTNYTNTSFGKSRTRFQANPSVKPKKIASETNTRSSGRPPAFACEHCD